MLELIKTASFIDLNIKITDILTFLAVILTLLTLIEIRNQRQSMYLPDLFIGNRFVSLYGFDLNKKFSDFTFDYLEKSKKNSEEDKQRNIHLELFIHNIGFGAAKYVKIKWCYDIDTFIKLIKEYSDSDQFRLEYNREKDKVGVIIEHKQTEHFSSCYNYLFNDQELDCVLPKHTIKESPRITVPESYTTLLSYLLSFKYEMFKSSKKHFIFDELTEIPKLTLNMTYYDIRNKKYSKDIDVKFDVSGEFNDDLERPDFGEHKLAMYSVKITEKK